jgi:hypothetical protein
VAADGVHLAENGHIGTALLGGQGGPHTSKPGANHQHIVFQQESTSKKFVN